MFYNDGFIPFIPEQSGPDLHIPSIAETLDDSLCGCAESFIYLNPPIYFNGPNFLTNKDKKSLLSAILKLSMSSF